MQLEVGKTYRARNGKDVVIGSKAVSNTPYPYRGEIVGEMSDLFFTDEGWFVNPGTMSDLDLLYEVVNGHHPGSVISFDEWSIAPRSHSEPTTKTCSHVWVKYLGLMEKFEYCKDCGVKKG